MPIVRAEMDLTAEVNRIVEQTVRVITGAVQQVVLQVQPAPVVKERVPSHLPEVLTGAAMLALIGLRSQQARRGATRSVEQESEEGGD